MTIKELIEKLREYPSDLEVFIEVGGREGVPKGIDWEAGGASAWIKIHDFEE